MANIARREKDRFLIFPGFGQVQPNPEVGVLNEDITWRHKAGISVDDVVERYDQRDCRSEDLVDQIIRTRARRFNLQYDEVTPQILAFYLALFLGQSEGTFTTSQNEIQTIDRTGTVNGGAFKLRFSLEGRTVTTKAIPYDATADEIENALTTSKMVIIKPGDVQVSGSWGSGIDIEFTQRLGKANLPLLQVIQDSEATLLGGGSISVAELQAGDQNQHEFTRNPRGDKLRTSFVTGWEGENGYFEKYVGFVVDNINISLNRRQPVTLTVSLLGPWEPEVLSEFNVPECETLSALFTDDCRVLIDSLWETTDINTLTVALSDNVPTDEASAFGFDDTEIQDLERADSPDYNVQAGIFGSEVDSIYQLAKNERTAPKVPVEIYLGTPGNRAIINFPNSKVMFQTNPMTNAGSLRKSVVQIQAIPHRVEAEIPVNAQAWIDQSEDFLQVSPSDEESS